MTKDIDPIEQCNDGKFNAFTGLKVDLLNLTSEMITLTDIATGLSNICRFGGQIQPFYSVAEHTILVWWLAPQHLKRAALLHDAAEAYLGDVIKPFKVLLGKAYAEYENVFEEVIFKKYQVSLEELSEIKANDLAALGLEHAYLRKGESYLPDLMESINKLIGIKHRSPYERLLHLLTKEFGRYDN